MNGAMPEGHGQVTRHVTAEAAGAADAAPSPFVPPQHFYRTAALACPYVSGRIERKLITELTGHEAPSFYNALSRAGFRRSHHLAYRPACVGCKACVPVRIPLATFALSRSLRRIQKTNDDLAMRVVEPRATIEQSRLVQRHR